MNGKSFGASKPKGPQRIVKYQLLSPMQMACTGVQKDRKKEVIFLRVLNTKHDVHQLI